MRYTIGRGGFTIIEVMLFLAVSGMMVAGVILAINGMISQQRYTEAVTSFQDYMQGQYTIVTDVRNNRPNTYGCSTSGVQEGGASQSARGTSTCTVIGRYIRTTGNNGTQIVSSPVYATVDITSPAVSQRDPTASIAQQALDLGLKAAPDTLTDDDDSHTLAWQTHLYTDAARRDSSGEFGAVLVRMPTTGLVQTFIRTGVPSSPENISQVISNASSTAVPLCVASGSLVASPSNGIRLVPSATNAGSVQFIPADGECK